MLLNKMSRIKEREREWDGKREREKESGTVRQSSSKEPWKFQVNEINSGGRVFLVKYIYISNRLWMYEILLWQLKPVSTICTFCHQSMA